jgi:cytidylate kinase
VEDRIVTESLAPPPFPRVPEHPPVVTLATLYGAGGTVVGRRAAERLGVPFLDRQIPEAVAARSGVSANAIASVDDAPRGRRERFFAGLGRATTMTDATGESGEQLDAQDRALRGHVEEFLAGACASGGVVLGRGGMVVLRTLPWALHVQLSGPREARIAQAMALEGIDRATATRRLDAEDDARIAYVRRAYGVDGADPSFYHLLLDSTALDLDTCVDFIVAGAEARRRDPRPSPPV